MPAINALTSTLEASPTSPSPSDGDAAFFQSQGYFIARRLAPVDLRQQMWLATLDGLGREVGPIEYEADLHYPGAPESRDAAGGRTIRRLKQAHSRDMAFTDWAACPSVTDFLSRILGPRLVMPLAHHNCVMTKQPNHSSETGWHQDIRYWSFERPELVSVWLALGVEDRENGCLQVIPGTHRMAIDRGRLDDALFLRSDLPENQELLRSRIFVELEAGDVLFFHCRTFHAAGRNLGDAPKFSVVCTYRAADNPPKPGSRSAALPELLLPSREAEC